MADSNSGHVMIFSFEALSHTRSLSTLVYKLTRLWPGSITFFVAKSLYDQIKAEIARNVKSDDDAARVDRQVRLIAVHTGDTFNPLEKYKTGEDAYIATYRKLLKNEPVSCCVTGDVVQDKGFPRTIIVDILLSALNEVVQNESTFPVKVLAWYTASVSHALRMYGPPKFGGNGNVRNTIPHIIPRIDQPFSGEADAAYVQLEGSTRSVPGLPLMYDYEVWPQELPGEEPGYSGPTWMITETSLEKSHGIIVSSPEILEPQACAALQQWYSEQSKSAFIVGPLIADNGRNDTDIADIAQSKDGPAIIAFLDKVLQTHGEHSLLYLSFGTIFWSKYPEIVGVFLDVVMKKRIPFIMSRAAMMAIISDEMQTKIDAYDLGLVSYWCPQQAILSHPVTGWFVSHCGQNSTIEAVASGVPMICWPYFADQPLNAANMTVNHDVAYELFEVRTGQGLRPIHRLERAVNGLPASIEKEASDMLERAFGEDGKTKRRNMRRLQRELLAAEGDGTSSDRDLRALVASFGAI